MTDTRSAAFRLRSACFLFPLSKFIRLTHPAEQLVVDLSRRAEHDMNRPPARIRLGLRGGARFLLPPGKPFFAAPVLSSTCLSIVKPRGL